MTDTRLQDQPSHHGAVGFFYKRPINDTTGFFSISRLVNPANLISNDRHFRCDIRRKIGPYGVHQWDENLNLCSCGLNEQPNILTGYHGIEFGKMTAFYPVIEALPYGIILYFELEDPDKENDIVSLPHSENARTLPELLRLMLEWDYAYTYLNSTEFIAKLCHDMLSVIDIPDDIRNWLLDDVSEEKVARFLSGDPDARIRKSSPPDIPDYVSIWLCNKITSCRSIGDYSA